MSTRTLDINLDELNAQLAPQSAEEIVRRTIELFGKDRVAVQASMQKTSGVLMHMASQIASEIDVLFVDTGVHFPETLELRDEFARRFPIHVVTASAARSFDQQFEDYKRYLHETDDRKPDAPLGYQECCRLRKEVPFIEAARGKYDAVIGGLTRAEGGARKNVQVFAPDPRFEGYKVYPLVNWTEEMVDEYTAKHDLPVHPLYAKGYTSIGCWTCTTPTAPGEHPRAGRWRHLNEPGGKPMYCGINLEDKQ